MPDRGPSALVDLAHALNGRPDPPPGHALGGVQQRIHEAASVSAGNQTAGLPRSEVFFTASARGIERARQRGATAMPSRCQPERRPRSRRRPHFHRSGPVDLPALAGAAASNFARPCCAGGAEIRARDTGHGAGHHGGVARGSEDEREKEEQAVTHNGPDLPDIDAEPGSWGQKFVGTSKRSNDSAASKFHLPSAYSLAHPLAWLVLLFLATVELPASPSALLLPYLVASFMALRYCRRDRRLPCPSASTAWLSPCASASDRAALEPDGTEFLCPHGHGALFTTREAEPESHWTPLVA